MSQIGGFLIVVILFALAVVLGIIVYYVEIKDKSEICKTDSDCNGLKCVSQKCVCTDNSQCQSGEICSNGFCIDQKACKADSDCPVGQICGTNGFCATSQNYIVDIVGVTDPSSCPAGYELMEGTPPATGNLKQGTGTGTPNIFLCLQRDPNVSQGGITDLTVAKFYTSDDTGTSCSDFRDNTQGIVYGDNDEDISKGCGIDSPYTNLCYGKLGPQILTDLIVVNGSGPQFCPAGYFQISTWSDDGNYTDQTANLNEDCGGPVIQLCGKY